MSTKRQHLFSSFKEAVRYCLKKRRKKQQWLVDQLGVGKGNLSKIINGKRTLTPEVHGNIEGALGFKIEEQPNGQWAVRKVEEATNLQHLIGALEQKLSDGNNKVLDQDDPLKVLEVAEKLIREYRLLLKMKGRDQ